MIEINDKSVECSSNSSNNRSNCKNLIKRRYIVAIMCLLGTAVMYMVRTNLSVAIVSMSKKYEWSSIDQGLVLSSFFYGYIVTQVPGGALAKRVSPHLIYGIAIGITAMLTLITPLSNGNLTAVVFIRVIEGLVLGVTYPAMMTIIANWAPPLERSKITMICCSGSQVGTVSALLGSGYLNDFFGYESIFYFFGFIGIVWFLAWMILVRESPEKDPWISEREKNYIIHNIGNKNQPVSISEVPWLSILSSGPVWVLVAMHITYSWGAYTLLTQMPTFLSDTINLKLGSTGFFSCLPYIITGCVSVPAGTLSDLLISRGILTTVQARKTFTCCGFAVQTFFLLLAAYLMSPVGSIVCLTLGTGVQAFTLSGYGINYLDIAPQYAGLLYGFTNTFGTLTGILSPLLTGVIVRNKHEDEWKIVFYIAAALYIIGIIVYGLFATSDLQKWAQPKENEDLEEEKSIIKL